MKKILQLFATVFVVTTLFTLTACGSDDFENDLVGTWIWELNPAFIFTIEADGTGSWGGSIFEWEVSGNELRMTLEVDHTGLGVHRWTPEIDGDTLTITSLQTYEVYVYIRR